MRGVGCLEMGAFSCYIDIFLEIPHDAAYGKILICFIFHLLTNIHATMQLLKSNMR